MKKLSWLFLLLWLVTGPVSLAAQITEGNIYVITTDGWTEVSASTIKIEMESRFNIYNRFFRFDPSLLAAPLRVRVFGNKYAYDRYILEQLGETRAGAVYLHYNQIDKRELVIHRGSPEEAFMTGHQAFVQYLRAFISNPPSWLLDGFAIFYSTLGFDEAGYMEYYENLAYLEAVKNLKETLFTPEAVFLADEAGSPAEYLSPEALDDFKMYSWALVSFLLNSGDVYYRNLWECFMLLTPDATAAENTEALRRRFILWMDLDEFEREFRDYIDSRKTYRELMEEGQTALSSGELRNAELSFLSAMDQRPHEHAPYYNMGLTAYEGKNYDAAERYFKASLERGADAPLINYALGINALAADRVEEAVDYLYLAAGLDPSRFRTRVDELLKRLWGN